MNKSNLRATALCLLFFTAATIVSCSKSDPRPAPVTDPCQGKTIVVGTTITDAPACASSGKIKVTATGSNGFTYKLNSGGTYQADDSFSDLSAGTYTIFAKDAAGCERSTSATVNSAGTAGPLFTAVKNLMVVKCQSCHNNSVQNGSMNWAVDCNIVVKSARINERAVVLGTMPQGGSLTQSEKDIISSWITAGAEYTD